MATETEREIAIEWLADSRGNEGGDQTVEGWVSQATNASDVDFDEDGNIYADRWLSFKEAQEVRAQIDAGV